MTIKPQLEYQAILANQACPVNFAMQFQAPEITKPRPKPAAFCIVLDRSGSMAGPPLERAKEAAIMALRNLRQNDQFGLVIFDHSAQTLIPLQTVKDMNRLRGIIESIQPGGSTNLTGGWMLGRDEVKNAPEESARRILLLSDGLQNQGITDPVEITQIVASGLEHDSARTSCLGFGNQYNEELLTELAVVTGGQFYDADSPEQLPGIFNSELDGLQKLADQNVRVRIKLLDFCDGFEALGSAPVVDLPDGRKEYALGDLISSEERVLCFELSVLPLPMVDGQPVVSLEGEPLLEVEVAYDELGETEISSKTYRQTIRIQSTQDPGAVQLNGQVVSWVATQQAGRILRKVRALLDRGKFEEGLKELEVSIKKLEPRATDPNAREALDSLREMEAQIKEGGWNQRSSKAHYYAHYRHMKMSSRDYLEFKRRQQESKKPDQDPPEEKKE